MFNGKDFTGWKVPEGDNGHWKVVDGVIDYDAESEAEGNKSLWTEKSYRDFILKVDWRIKETPWSNPRVPLILPNGDHKLNEHGEEIKMIVPDSDSGILYRGQGGEQANIWCWPIGSGEVYGIRMDRDLPPEIRAGVTPTTNADKNIGEWNSFVITLRGNIITVELNGITVIEEAELPGLPEERTRWLTTPRLETRRRMGQSPQPRPVPQYFDQRDLDLVVSYRLSAKKLTAES